MLVRRHFLMKKIKHLSAPGSMWVGYSRKGEGTLTLPLPNPPLMVGVIFILGQINGENFRLDAHRLLGKKNKADITQHSPRKSHRAMVHNISKLGSKTPARHAAGTCFSPKKCLILKLISHMEKKNSYQSWLVKLSFQTQDFSRKFSRFVFNFLDIFSGYWFHGGCYSPLSC